MLLEPETARARRLGSPRALWSVVCRGLPARSRHAVSPVRIKAVGPHHRSCLVIDADLPEVVEIAQGLPERPVKQEGTVNIALYAIVERDPQVIAVQRLDAGDSQHHSSFVVEFDLCARSVRSDQVSSRLPSRLQTLSEWTKPLLPVNGRYDVHCHGPT